MGNTVYFVGTTFSDNFPTHNPIQEDFRGRRDMFVGVFAVDETIAISLVSFMAETTANQVSITWETAGEIDNEGFNIWRSEAEAGEYVKINDTLIPAEGATDSGASYEYIDTDVVKGKTYYYKLEDIDTNGVSAFHGPASATPGQTDQLYLPVIVK